MKKTILTLALVVAVGVAGINIAEARWGGGWMMGAGGGNGAGYCNGPGGWNNSEKTTTFESREKFHNETADLRKQMHEKRSEYYAAINQENPDKELAKELWSQMFDLQNEMHKKAEEAGMQPGYGMGRRF